MQETIIDRIYSEHQELTRFLGQNEQPSFSQIATDDFRKLLALSAASFFEHTITEAILKFCTIRAKGDPALFCLVRMKAVERQYATYFDWNGKTANTFFKLFGEPLGASMREDVKGSPELKSSCESFLDLGYLRNSLVHQNFASFALDKTAEEVYGEYKEASRFVDYVVTRLSEETGPLTSPPPSQARASEPRA